MDTALQRERRVRKEAEVRLLTEQEQHGAALRRQDAELRTNNSQVLGSEKLLREAVDSLAGQLERAQRAGLGQQTGASISALAPGLQRPGDDLLESRHPHGHFG